MKLYTILKSYLNDSIINAPITGGENHSNPILENEIFIIRLEKNSQFNNKLIVTYVVVLLLSFCLICYLIWYFILDKTIILGLLGGEGFSIFVILKQIHRLYKDKIFTDQMLYLIPKLTTEVEKRDFIKALLEFLK
jgi:hypothetical protein